MSTVPVQVRLSADLVAAIDQRAKAAKIGRADVLRGLVETAIIGAKVPEHDPLLVKIGDVLGTLLARTDTLMEISESARQQAHAAYATAHLHALTMLPTVQQQAFTERLKEKLS